MQNQFTTPEPSVFTTPALAPEPGTENAAVTSDTLSEQDLASQQAQTKAVDALLTATQRKIQRRKIKFWGSFYASEGALLFIMLPLCFMGNTSAAALIAIGVSLVVGLIAAIGMVYLLLSPLDFSQEELARVGGARAISPLLDSLSSGRTPGRRAEVHRALTILLPQLKATDSILLSARNRRGLSNVLNLELRPSWWTLDKIAPSFPLAILKAYEQVGDAKAVPVVEKLANMKVRTPRQRAIQQAAAQCLPLLQSHTTPLDQNQTLLRAASQSNATPDILLRPAEDAAPVPAGELLRAVEDFRADVRTDA